MDKDNFAALRLEPELHPAQRTEGAGDGLMAVGSCVEQEKPAGAGAQQLTASSPGLARLEIPVVNGAGGNAWGERFLKPPALVEEFAERRQPIELQVAAQIARQTRHSLGHLLLFLLRRQGALLATEDVRRAAGQAREKKQQIGLDL